MTFEEQKQWSDRYLPEVKGILGKHLISEAPVEEDKKRCTDLIVLHLQAIRIACRMRRETYIEKYSDEFTIRAVNHRGAKTELAKIIEGWGDYFFYGFGGDSGLLLKWCLCDLKVFRLWYVKELYNGNKPGILHANTDKSSDFLSFKINALPSGFVIAQSGLEATA